MYKDFYAIKQLFDFSRHGKETPFYNDKNKKAIVKIKDELNREITEEFVGLRVKMYSLKTKKEAMKKANEVRRT